MYKAIQQIIRKLDLPTVEPLSFSLVLTFNATTPSHSVGQSEG